MDVTIYWCSYVYCEMQVNVSCSKIGRCGGGECILQATEAKSLRKNTRSVSPEESYIIISLIIVYYDQHVLLLITQQDINHQTWNIDLTRQLKAKVIYRPIQHVCVHLLWSKVVGAQSVAQWCDLKKETNCTLSLLKYCETAIYYLAKTEAECILWSALCAWRHV